MLVVVMTLTPSSAWSYGTDTYEWEAPYALKQPFDRYWTYSPTSGHVPYGRNFFFDADYAFGLLTRFKTAQEFKSYIDSRKGWEAYDAWEAFFSKEENIRPKTRALEALETNPDAARIKRRRDDWGVVYMWTYFLEHILADDPTCETTRMQTFLKQTGLQCDGLPDWKFKGVFYSE